MIHSYVRHDSLICETYFMFMWYTTHSYGRHDSFICETWFMFMWHMTYSYVRHDVFLCETPRGCSRWVHVLQCVALRYSVLQCVAVCCRITCDMTHLEWVQCICCSVLQCVTMSCGVLHCVAMCCSVLHNHMWYDSPWMSAVRVLVGCVWTTPTTPWL